jgi:hypothetical protein
MKTGSYIDVRYWGCQKRTMNRIQLSNLATAKIYG